MELPPADGRRHRQIILAGGTAKFASTMVGAGAGDGENRESPAILIPVPEPGLPSPKMRIPGESIQIRAGRHDVDVDADYANYGLFERRHDG
uniref:DUF2188 domain-containing protein n=1 Tax=Globodera pallida TaxID=36090 RepID=A0A183BQV7_GLOPA